MGKRWKAEDITYKTEISSQHKKPAECVKKNPHTHTLQFLSEE